MFTVDRANLRQGRIVWSILGSFDTLAQANDAIAADKRLSVTMNRAACEYRIN